MKTRCVKVKVGVEVNWNWSVLHRALRTLEHWNPNPRALTGTQMAPLISTYSRNVLDDPDKCSSPGSLRQLLPHWCWRREICCWANWLGSHGLDSTVQFRSFWLVYCCFFSFFILFYTFLSTTYIIGMYTFLKIKIQNFYTYVKLLCDHDIVKSTTQIN